MKIECSRQMFKLYYIDSTRALKGSKGASLQAALDWYWLSIVGRSLTFKDRGAC